MMKNPFYFILKAPFVLEIFTFSFRFCGYVQKKLDKKTMINSEIYDFTNKTTSSYNIHNTQYFKK